MTRCDAGLNRPYKFGKFLQNGGSSAVWHRVRAEPDIDADDEGNSRQDHQKNINRLVCPKTNRCARWQRHKTITQPLILPTSNSRTCANLARHR